MVGVSLLLRSQRCNRVDVYCVLSVQSDVEKVSWVLPPLKLHSSTMEYYFIPNGQMRKPVKLREEICPQEPSIMELTFEFSSLAGGFLINPLRCFSRTGLNTSTTGSR